MHPYLLTAVAMLAFAANSVLCRLALDKQAGEDVIDAFDFTSIRLISGATTLVVLVVLSDKTFRRPAIRPLSILMLFSYMICFSFSYIKVSTGTGALILFGTVQITMIIAGILRGERPSLATLIGTTLATAGMIYLLLPGIDAPPVFNALLMGIAGFSWAIYTLAGKKTDNPLADTMWNFVGTLPLLLIGFLVFQNRTTVPFDGAVYAVLSGSLASAMGYTIWYSALKALNSSQAATVQLSVPVLAAAAGVILLSEPYSWRMVFSGIFILGGIYLTIKNKASG